MKGKPYPDVRSLQPFKRGLRWAALIVLIWSAAAGAPQGKLHLVTGGHSPYRIVLSDDASVTDRKAASELQRYLTMISGAVLEITTGDASPDDSLVWIRSSGSSGGVSAGTIDWQGLQEDGFLLRTEGTRLTIAGGTRKGTLYGVYTFLEKYLACRKFSPTVEVIPRKRTIVLGRIEDREVPRIRFRMENFYEPSYAAWHKLETHRDNWGLFVHTARVLVPPEKYFKDHPEYFSMVASGRIPDGQLCWTNPDVFRIVVEGLRERMKERPEAQFWSVSQNDTYSPCECESCKRINDEEGSPSGSLLAFVNRVADEFPDKTISTLAYQYSRSAPRQLRPRKNVNIMLCSIECNRSRPIRTDPSSASFRKDVEDWTNLTGNIFLWDYTIQFRNLVSPFPNLRVLQPNIRFFADHGITSVFEQGLGSMQGEFAELRTYLIAKLLWDPEISVDSVIDDFCRGYYGKAAPFIRRYIDTMHDALEASGEDLWIYGYPLPSVHGHLSPEKMVRYGGYFDRAEKAVAADPPLLHRVQKARLPLQFALLEQAKVYGTGPRGFYYRARDGNWKVKPSMKSLLATFVSRCRREGIHRLEESGTPPEAYRLETEKLLRVSMKKHLALFKPVILAVPASTKYHNGEQSALTDGLKGWNDYHMNYLGWEGEDMEAVIDLGRLQTVRRVSSDFLQDINSWVFMPLGFEVAVSPDGSRYTTVGRMTNDVPEQTAGAFSRAFGADFQPLKARYIRVKASSRKTCPLWHKGAGGLAWIFTDEIVVE